MSFPAIIVVSTVLGVFLVCCLSDRLQDIFPKPPKKQYMFETKDGDKYNPFTDSTSHESDEYKYPTEIFD